MLLPRPLALLFLAAPALVASQRANTWEVTGTVGVSPQQAFAVDHIVYIVDKVENNTAQIAGHPAWAGYYNTDDNSFTTQDIVTNSFCAGGTVMGNGSWVNIGGNAAVGPLGIGLAADSPNPYGSTDGGRAVRMFTPCTDGNCEWLDDFASAMPLSRWYPTVEALEDGTVVIIGGELYGSFVNTPQGLQNVPTYEYWPSRGDPINMTFLEETMPVNLYPLTWLLSDGRLFLQAGWQTTLLDYENNVETRLPNITHAQRPYPAGAGSAMLPLLPSNNYTETLIFAGGMTPERDDWNQNEWHPVDTQASASLVSITPLAENAGWTDLDDLPEGRSMGNLIILPDKRIWMGNGAAYGSEGYGWDSWAAPYGQSYAREPVLRPAYLNTSAPAGQMWDTSLSESEVPRMYHSVATLLYDGSIWVGGSNPNVDVITDENNASYPFKTEYRVERFYPSYYDSPRPVPSGLPTSLSYGGSPFVFTLPSSSLSALPTSSSASAAEISSQLSIMVIRTGFSTHVMNMGQRAIELVHSVEVEDGGEVRVSVQQLPPNPALFQPGPALLFVVLSGVPSNATTVMIGSGELGTQPTSALVTVGESSEGGGDGGSSASAQGESNSAPGAMGIGWAARMVAVLAAVIAVGA
ncbi:hypothetical protein JCM8547_008892 [Rhodosporidiobolus lusitaniae]